MSSKSRFRGRRKGRHGEPVAARPAPTPRLARAPQDPPDLAALKAAMRRCQGRAVVKVLPDIHGRPNPIISFADDAAKAEFERAMAEELAARRVVLPQDRRVVLPHEVSRVA